MCPGSRLAEGHHRLRVAVANQQAAQRRIGENDEQTLHRGSSADWAPRVEPVVFGRISVSVSMRPDRKDK